jgi:signal transduction histidine kinase
MARSRSLNQITLRYSAIYLALVVVTGLMGTGGLYLWQKNSQESQRLQSMIQHVESMRGTLYRQMKELFDATFLDDPLAQSQYREFSQEIEGELHQLAETARPGEEAQAVIELKRAYREIYQRTNMVAFGPVPAEGRVLQRVFDSDLENGGIKQYESAFERIDALLNNQQHALQAKLASLVRYTTLILVIPMMLAIGLWVLTHRFLRNHFVRPLSQVLKATAVLSHGELEHPVPREGARELVALADAINAMAADLAQSRKALISAERQATLGSLVPIVAHNIRNPLASIRATAQIIDDAQLPGEVREGLKGIMDSCDRLERWTESLLSYLHPLEAQRHSTVLAPLVEDLVGMTQTLAQSRKVNLVSKTPRQPVAARIDPELVEQALHGLIVNSIEASPLRGTVQVSLQSDGDRATFAIRDEGPGLPFAPEAGRLVPGPTTKRSGTGLGIPFALKVFEVHGGGVQFQARPEGGTEALLWLPLS